MSYMLIFLGNWFILGLLALLINYKFYSKKFPPREDCVNVILFGLITLVVVLGVIYEDKIRHKNNGQV